MAPFENVYSSADDLYAYKHRTRRRVIAFVKLIVALFILYEIISAMLVSTFAVASASMKPALYPGDRVLTLPVLYGARVPFTQLRIPSITPPRRGDIVVVRPPYWWPAPWYLRIADPVVRFFTLQRVDLVADRPGGLEIKRVVGVPGDNVKMEQFTIYVKPAGSAKWERAQSLSQKVYDVVHDHVPDGWPASFPLSGNLPVVVLGPRQYFVAGDNRSDSSDSTVWGAIDERSIVAKVVFRYWPPTVISAL